MLRKRKLVVSAMLMASALLTLADIADCIM
jgi:hypothetical protein